MECYLLDEVILKSHAAQVMACYDMLCDQKSKDVYAELIRWRVTGIQPQETIQSEDEYFAMDYLQGECPDDVFVDCGAWVGDIVSEFIRHRNGVFRKVIAFEPDAVNYGRLEKTVECECAKWQLTRSQFALYPYPVSDARTAVSFQRYGENDGQGSKIIDTAGKSEDGTYTVALDDFLHEPYSFLKADIESYEYKMIQGAAEGIRQYKPKLAICIYHNCVDIYSIPLLIKQIMPEYRISVRHYAADLTGSVLHAIV